MVDATKARSSEARKEVEALQARIEACSRDAEELARKHNLAGSHHERLCEGLAEAECGIIDLLLNDAP